MLPNDVLHFHIRLVSVLWFTNILFQIFHNFRRGSVEGLSFDFLGLNFTGGIAYAMFNLGLYCIPPVIVSAALNEALKCKPSAHCYQALAPQYH